LGVKGIGIELEIYGDKGVNDEKGYLQEREGYYFPRERGAEGEEITGG
jgi:hypothetical protein